MRLLGYVGGFLARWRWAHVAQSAEHFLGKEEVTGSIPVVGFDFIASRRRLKDGGIQ